MKKFRFKLETILKHRKRREEDILRALGAAQSAYQAQLGFKAGLARELDESLVRRENLAKNGVTINFFRLEQDFINGQKQRMIMADQAIIRASRSVEKALRAYLHARRQSQMIEKIREQHFALFKKELARQEQKQVDDLTVMRSHLRKEEEADMDESETEGVA